MPTRCDTPGETVFLSLVDRLDSMHATPPLPMLRAFVELGRQEAAHEIASLRRFIAAVESAHNELTASHAALSRRVTRLKAALVKQDRLHNQP